MAAVVEASQRTAIGLNEALPEKYSDADPTAVPAELIAVAMPSVPPNGSIPRCPSSALPALSRGKPESSHSRGWLGPRLRRSDYAEVVIITLTIVPGVTAEVRIREVGLAEIRVRQRGTRDRAIDTAAAAKGSLCEVGLGEVAPGKLAPSK